MKAITFILTITLTFGFAIIYGQHKTKLTDKIQKEFKAINADTTLRTVSLSNEEFLEHPTDGGGQLTGFYKAGQLKKIVSWIGLSNGNRIFEFYFDDQMLFFVYEQFNSFIYDDEKQTFRLDTTEITFEGRYYFSNNKLIDQVTLGHNRFEDDSIDAETTLLKEANDNKKLLEQQMKNIR